MVIIVGNGHGDTSSNPGRGLADEAPEKAETANIVFLNIFQPNIVGKVSLILSQVERLMLA